uniref:Chondroitin sulfate proteoglycan 5-like n=1 Tax=Labrus bergylta TaxID=56723 RepID=A0A3Q3E006_9LABR
MARADSPLGTWHVLLTISLVIAPLKAHGRHSLGRHHHHHNQSSVNKGALNTGMVLSDDSAERDHLIGAGLRLGGTLPLSSTKRHHSQKHTYLDFIEEDTTGGEELTAGGAGPDQPGNPMSDDVITVAFHSPTPDVAPPDGALDWDKVPKPQKQKSGGPTAWTLSDFYDYLSPDDDLSALDPTPDPEPTPSPPPDMEDENPLLSGAPVVSENVRPNGVPKVESKPSLLATPRPRPNSGDSAGFGGAIGADGCRLGFVRSGPGVCVPQCDIEPNFCFNGGVCTVVAGMGAFCRCNVQDYIWNKGTRCDWMVTEFQVLCVVVGVSSSVLILLFMIIVFFAKRLHRLKNENKRLRKRSKFRPQSSEPQTDGLSVSTTADGSQPNKPSTTGYTWEYKPKNPYNNFQDDPQKQVDPSKSPQAKEEGSMNILNSHSPKHENNRPTSVAHTPNNTEENAEDGVTIGLEVLLPKDAKLHPDMRPALQYDVFLYKVPNNGGSASSLSQTPSAHTVDSYSSHPMPRSPKSPKSPKTPKSPRVPKSPRHIKEQPHSPREPMSGRHSSPCRHPSPSCHPLPSSHIEPVFLSSSTCHHQSPMPTSISCSPLLQRPRGRSQGPDSEHEETGKKIAHIRPSPSSPHLTQPPPSPSKGKYSPASTRSLPLS